jgi:hypothetical protein
VHIENPAAVLAGATPRDALHEQLRVHIEEDRRIERLADRCEHLLETFGLRHGAREPVEDETAGRIGRREALTHHAEDGGVVDQLAGVHDGLGAATELRTVAHMRTQQVAGRDLRDAMTLDEALRLGALAGTRSAEEDDSHVLRDLRRPCLGERAHGTRPFPAGQMLRYPPAP